MESRMKRVLAIVGFSEVELAAMSGVLESLSQADWHVKLLDVLPVGETEETEVPQFGINIVKLDSKLGIKALEFAVQNFVEKQHMTFLYLIDPNDEGFDQNGWGAVDLVETAYARQKVQHVPFAVLPLTSQIIPMVVDRLHTLR